MVRSRGRFTRAHAFLLSLGTLGLALGASPVHGAPQARYQMEFGDPEGAIARKLTWRRALREEREVPVLETWQALDDPGRARLVGTLDQGVDPRRSRKRPLPMEFLSRAWRGQAQASEDGARAPWLDMVDSVDLRVLPGVFNARSEGRGEPMTVRLTSIWDSLADQTEKHDLPVRLIWHSPTGEETVARQEVAGIEHFEEGFDMYIRPPASGPGLWELTLEVETPAGRVESLPVSVECVADLPGLVQRLEGERPPGLAQALGRRLDLLREYGIRVASGTSIADWVEALEAPRPEALGLQPISGEEVGVPGEVFWQLRRTEQVRGVLLVLVNRDESPADLFRGPRLDAWSALAEEQGLLLLAGHVPISLDSAEGLSRCLARIRKGWPGALHLLGRGEGGQLVPSLLARHPELALDSLILSEILGPGGRLPKGIACPVLQVVTGLSARSGTALEEGEDRERRTRVLLPAQDPVAPFQAVEILHRWIPSL